MSIAHPLSGVSPWKRNTFVCNSIRNGVASVNSVIALRATTRPIRLIGLSVNTGDPVRWSLSASDPRTANQATETVYGSLLGLPAVARTGEVVTGTVVLAIDSSHLPAGSTTFNTRINERGLWIPANHYVFVYHATVNTALNNVAFVWEEYL